MPRIVYVHWNAEEAEARAEKLRAAGHVVAAFSAQNDVSAYRRLAARPPDCIVIDLARLPSHGRELGGWLRRQQATRAVPLVFVAGDSAKTERARALLPDATFTPWSRVRGAVTRALKRRTSVPVVPGAFAGYADTPLPKKLGIKAGTAVTLLGAPADFLQALGNLPPGAGIKRRAGRPSPVSMLFVRSNAELARRWSVATRSVSEGGRLWLCWPKRASGVKTDLNQNTVRAYGLERGWVDFKIAAIDATWSALAFTRRKDPS